MKIKRIDLQELNLVVDMFDKYRIFYKQPSDLELAEKFLNERLSKNESVIFLAYLEEQGSIVPIGFTQLYPKTSSVSAIKNWHIGDLYTEPAYRKSGVGKELLATAAAFAKQDGAAHVSLYTATDNLTAQNVYHKFGFYRPDLQGFFYYQYDILKNE